MTMPVGLRRVFSLLTKELLQVARDPASLVIAFVLPVALMLLMGFGIDLDLNRAPIGITMQDDSAAARSLAGAFQSSRYFEVVDVGPVERMRDLMVAGRVRGIVVIPVGFGRDAANGHPQAQLLTDGAYPNPAKFLEIYAQGVQANWAAGQAQDRGVDLSPAIDVNARFWFNPSVASRNFLVPGSIAVVMTIVGSLLTALVIAREWEGGTMEALMSTPMRISEFLMSKVLPYFGLGLIAMTICTVMAVFLFGVPLRGSIPMLLLVSSAYLLPALGQGLLISAALKNQFVASQVALLLAFLPSLFLSGFVYEIASMPVAIQWLTAGVPARYFIPQLLTVFLVGDDWASLLPKMAVLLGVGIGTLLLCGMLTRRRVA